MSSENVRRLRRATVLCLTSLFVAPGWVFAVKPDSVNRKDGNMTRYWIARRHASDPHEKSGNIALAVQIVQPDGASKAIARIWQYRGVKEDPKKEGKHLYDAKKISVVVCECEIKQLGSKDDIVRETITLTKDDQIVGWITRWQGGQAVGSPKGRRHARVLFRFAKDFHDVDAEARATPEGSNKRELTDPCEAPPADDVLEEESLPPPDDPETTPPDISYEP